MSQTYSPKIVKQYDKAKGLCNGGNPEQALSLFKDIIRKEKGMVEA